MSISRSSRAKTLVVLGSLILAGNVAGCNSSNPNEQEFLRSAPPGKPTENPDESYSQRRSRTRLVGKKLAAIEARNEAAAKKKAEAEKKAH